MNTLAFETSMLTVSPLTLLYNGIVGAPAVVLRVLDPDNQRFDVVHGKDYDDCSLSFSLSPERLTIAISDPEQFAVHRPKKLDKLLPEIVVLARHGDEEVELERFGTLRKLVAPATVSAGGIPEDLVIRIDFAGSSPISTLPPDDQYCEISWTVAGRPRSLRFTVVGGSDGPLILRPRRED